MRKNLLKRLEKLFVAREKYKKLEREIYKVFEQSDIGNHELFDGTFAYIGENTKYEYSKEFTKTIEDLYKKERNIGTIKNKKTLYVKFIKKDEE